VSGVFRATLRRELRIALRSGGDLANPLAFFVIVVTLFPLGITPSPATLARLAPGVLWVAALLATLLSVDQLFRGDLEDGSLEQMLASPQPVFVLVLAKVAAHWLVTGLPLALLAPVLAVMLHLPASGLPALEAALLLGTPTLSLVGAIGAALTVGVRRGGALIAVLVLPLYVPVLILGTLAVGAAVQGHPVAGHLLWLGAMLLLGLALAPLATAAGLRAASGG
jgi:heme exporter protein B